MTLAICKQFGRIDHYRQTDTDSDEIFLSNLRTKMNR